MYQHRAIVHLEPPLYNTILYSSYYTEKELLDIYFKKEF